MNKPSQKFRIYLTVAILFIFALGLLAGFYYTVTHKSEFFDATGEPQNMTQWPWDQAKPFPQVSLTNHLGEHLTREQLKGQWHFVFFGFTHCPDICPTTLHTLSQVRDQLAQTSVGSSTGYLFISVDPARDTPIQLHDYLAQFGTGFTGLRTSPEELIRLASAFTVAVGASTPPANIEHSGTLFVLNPEAQIQALFTAPHDANPVSHQYQLLRQNYEKKKHSSPHPK